MINKVELSRRAKKCLSLVPKEIFEAADLWRELVEESGIEVVQRIVAFRDHSLRGILGRVDIRSVRLSYSYRLYYRIVGDKIKCVLVEEVNNHDYEKVKRLFGG
jgi:hypothetical protein